MEHSQMSEVYTDKTTLRVIRNRPPLRIAQGVVPEVMHSVQLTGLAKRAPRARSARHRP